MEINLFPKFIDEAISPVAQSVGSTLSSVWNIVFGGIDAYSQKLEHKRKFNLDSFKQELENKVSLIPEEKLIEPPLHIIGPTLEASKFYFENEELRSMFANLIASSVNIDNSKKTHPSFVEIIKQLHPDEAKIIRKISDGAFPLLDVYAANKNNGIVPIIQNFSDLAEKSKCVYQSSITSYINNLSRLGLISIANSHLMDETLYDELLEHPVINEAKHRATFMGELEPLVRKKHFRVTPLGVSFYRTCCVEYRCTVINAQTEYI